MNYGRAENITQVYSKAGQIQSSRGYIYLTGTWQYADHGECKAYLNKQVDPSGEKYYLGYTYRGPLRNPIYTHWIDKSDLPLKEGFKKTYRPNTSTDVYKVVSYRKGKLKVVHRYGPGGKYKKGSVQFKVDSSLLNPTELHVVSDTGNWPGTKKNKMHCLF